MTPKHRTSEVRMIPIDRIDVLNPRDRNKRVFEEIVGNIKTIGLKKPITVTPRTGEDGAERYLLVCGEGRLSAFRSLGEAEIPALVVTVSDEDAFIMSLSENIARRQCRPLEILAGIKQLRDKGYSPKDIATKTGLTAQYVVGILTLLQQGEERLLIAVETGRVAPPLELVHVDAEVVPIDVQKTIPLGGHPPFALQPSGSACCSVAQLGLTPFRPLVVVAHFLGADAPDVEVLVQIWMLHDVDIADLFVAAHLAGRVVGLVC